MITPETLRRYTLRASLKIRKFSPAKARPMIVSGGRRVTVMATPGKELFNSFLAQVKLAAAPAAMGMRKKVRSVALINLINSISRSEKSIISPSKNDNSKDPRAETKNTLMERRNTFKLIMVKDREMDSMGESNGATNIPPIISNILFFRRPTVTMKVERIRRR